MTDSDRPRFAAALLAMAAIFDREIIPQVTNMYFQILGRFTITEVEGGILRACSTLRYFPRPVELVECIMDAMSMERRGEVEAVRIFGSDQEAIQ